MAVQNQTQNTKDDLLDQLSDVDTKLDQEETRKTQVKPAAKPHTARNIMLCALGICMGLGMHAVLAPSASDPLSTITNNNTISEDDLSDEEVSKLIGQWSKQTYTINGATYTFGSTLEDFEKNGWKIDTTDATPTAVLTPDQEVEMKLTNGAYKIESCAVTNNTNVNTALEKCTISHLYIFDEDTSATVVGPYGITSSMSQDEIKKIMKDAGLPYEADKYSYSQSYSSYLSGEDENNHYVSYDLSASFYSYDNSVSFSKYTSYEDVYVSF
jgi:hypothetical protein